jgi:dephospho-CoA kinase
VLRVGLSGGIGAGKSAVSTALAERGAVVIDADRLAREVVEPGTPGLAAVVAEFGADLLRPDGSLDRPALGQRVFADEPARRRLEGILHPLIGRRTADLVAAAPVDAVVVHDVPLLVEKGMGSAYHLVVVVGATADVRLARLTELRGMPAADARARIEAQADDEARRAAADVWLDNSGDLAELIARVEKLWRDRLVPFEQNLRARRAAAGPAVRVPYDPTWPAQADRLRARLALATGCPVDHVGLTAVPGTAAEDILDLELMVRPSRERAGTLRAGLADAGFPEVEPGRHASADPGRPARLQIRVDGRPAEPEPGRLV